MSAPSHKCDRVLFIGGPTQRNRFVAREYITRQEPSLLKLAAISRGPGLRLYIRARKGMISGLASRLWRGLVHNFQHRF